MMHLPPPGHSTYASARNGFEARRRSTARRLRRVAPALGLFSLTGWLIVACSESSAPDKTSSFQGSLALETFPHPPDAVLATNEAGSTVQTSVANTGDFRMELPRDHRYTLEVGSGAERVTVVFPRTSGLTSKFAVSSGAAVVSLGQIRYLSSAPGPGFFLKSAHVMVGADAADVAQGQLGDCVNGLLAGSGAICVDDAGDVACEGDGSDGDGECKNGVDTATGLACTDPVESSDGDGECKNGVDSTTGLACTDPPDASDGDGECQDGVDATTGLACTDPSESSDGDGECENGVDATTGLPCTDAEGSVDPHQPMAVAEHNVPDQVGGCDEGGGEEQND